MSARSYEAADVVHGVVELLRTHAGRSTLPEPSGQPSWSASRLLVDVLQVAHGEVVHLVAERVVTGPPPHQRNGARELDRLVGVEVVCVVPSVGRLRESWPNQIEPSDTTSWTTTPEPVVEDVGDVAQRAQVILDRLELADRHGRERGVLARRCRRSTGSPGSRRRSRSPWATVPSGAGNCLPWLVQRICRFVAVCVRSAMFCLPHSTAFCEQRIAGQRELRPAARAPGATRSWRPAAPPGPAARRRARCAASAEPWSEPATASHTVFEPPAGR